MSDKNFTQEELNSRRKNGLIVAFKKNPSASISTIPEDPLPFDIHSQPSTDFPIDIFPEEMKNFIQKLNDIVKAPLAMCAQGVLSAIALAAQAHANIFMDGRRYPLSLFCLTVGESGERKSAIDKIVLTPLLDHEKELHKQYEKNNYEYQQSLENYNSLRKNDKKEVASALIKPIEPIILVQEPTYEGLVKGYENGQPSLGLFSSEGGRFTGGHAMKQENRIKTVAGFSDLWSGEPISVSRSGEGNKKFYDKRLSLHLMFQPKIAFEIFGDAGLIDQGFLARCLIIYPDSTMGKRKYNANNVFNSPEYAFYSGKILQLIKNKFQGAFRDIHLSEKAKELAITFHDEIEEGLSEHGVYREISGFAAKSLEHACRIAGILGIFQNPTLVEIEKETMEKAIVLTRFYLAEAARLLKPRMNFVEALEQEILPEAEKLYLWMLSTKEKEGSIFPHIKLRYLQRCAPRKFREKEFLLRLLKILVDYSWLQLTGNDSEWFICEKK